MPDTHLAMPRSLSAELAQTPEALASHAPMTTSDATNGTAAAAAAFARLLASGDPAMQSDTENTASAAKHKPLPLKDGLRAGTAVTSPHPDAEILKLARRREALIAALDSALDDDGTKRLGDEWLEVDTRIMELQPKTGAGLAVQLAVVWRDLDMEPGEEGGPCPESLRPRQWLWKTKENAAKLDDDSATLDAFREFLSAQCGWDRNLPDDEAKALSDHCDALALEVMAREPTTAAGFAAQVYTWLHLCHGGSSRDGLLADYSPSYEPEHAHFAHNQAERAMVDRAFHMTEAIRSEERFRSRLRDKGSQAPVRTIEIADKGDDADLLELGRLHEDAIRDADAVHAIARPKGEAERIYARISGLKDRIFATEATTIAGLVVQLAALWDLQGPTLEEEGGPTEDSDIGLKAVWNIWQTARKLSGQDADIRPISRNLDDVSPEKREDIQRIGDIYDQLDAPGKAVVVAVARATIHLQQATNIAKAAGAEYPEALDGVAKMMRADAALLEEAANDQRRSADAFADTVAVFEAEAPETLSLPLEPTGRMIDAGADAAGITPEQFQAAYAAAVEALKLERAA